MKEASEPVSTVPSRVAIIGCGNVGFASAYALLLSGTAREIVLVDASSERAEEIVL